MIFETKIKPYTKKMPNGCIEWMRGKNRKGYGLFSLNGKTTSVHRYVYQWAKGIDPTGLLVCHSCDNPSCCNPKHLFLGDAFLNMQDMAAKGRTFGQKKTRCKVGHPLSGINLYICPRGYRECKECRRDNVRRKRARS